MPTTRGSQNSASSWHAAEQPSPDSVLPSSQPSLGSSSPLPQPAATLPVLDSPASELESGDASGLAVVRDTVNRIPGYSWDVSGPVTVDGDTLSATLNSRLGDYAFPIPVTWKNIGGTWKLSQESEETLVGYATMAW